MKKPGTKRAMSKAGREATQEATGNLDPAVRNILKTLRSGHSARLPGVGTINPGKCWTFQPEPYER